MSEISEREAFALALVICGLDNKEIAQETDETEMIIKHLLNRVRVKLGYKGTGRFRAKFVSDFFLGHVDDDQCALVFKYFAERRLKMEHEKNAGLPRGVN